MTCLHKSEPGFVLQQTHTSCWVFKLWAQRHTGSSEGRGPSVLWKRQSKTEAHTWVGGSGCWAQAAPVAALPTLVSGQRVYRILRVLVHMIFISALWRGLFPTARYAHCLILPRGPCGPKRLRLAHITEPGKSWAGQAAAPGSQGCELPLPFPASPWRELPQVLVL